METTLGIDTSGSYISTCVSRNEVALASVSFFAPRATLRYLVPTIHSALQQANLTLSDISLIAAITGPGSWTGLRIGVQTAKSISHARGGIPLVGIPTLTALAANAQLVRRPVACLLDARKEQSFVGLFDCSGYLPKPIREPWVAPKDALARQLPADSIMLGDNEFLGETDFLLGPVAWNKVDPAAVCRLGRQRISEHGPDDTLGLSPCYMQGIGVNETNQGYGTDASTRY